MKWHNRHITGACESPVESETNPWAGSGVGSGLHRQVIHTRGLVHNERVLGNVGRHGALYWTTRE